jgi:acyl-ACP thioesterase
MVKSVRNSTLDFPNLENCSIGEQIDLLHRILEIETFHHAEEQGIGDSTIRPRGQMWLVAKVATRLQRLPFAAESMRLRSTLHFGLASGVVWVIEGQNSDHQTIVEQVIWWTLADQATLRPVRVDVSLRGTPEDRLALKSFLAEWFPDSPGAIPYSAVFTREVIAEDIDQNHHVHNTTYLKYLFEAIPIVPLTYEIAYLQPLYLNDFVTLMTHRQGNRIFVLGQSSSNTQSVTAFTAAMTVNL